MTTYSARVTVERVVSKLIHLTEGSIGTATHSVLQGDGDRASDEEA